MNWEVIELFSTSFYLVKCTLMFVDRLFKRLLFHMLGNPAYEAFRALAILQKFTKVITGSPSSVVSNLYIETVMALDVKISCQLRT